MSKDILNTELTEDEIEQIKKEISFNDAARKKDTIILIILLAIGVLGLTFVLLSGKNDTFVQTRNSNKEGIHTTLEEKAKTFTIKGSFDTKSPIVINIKNYKEEDIYLMNFGDNYQKAYNSSIITYNYKKEGRYKLTLLNTKTFEVESKIIFINDKKDDTRLAHR